MKDCVICNLIKGEVPAWIIYEDEQVICFLPLEVQAFGHTLIAPKAHYDDLFSMPSEQLACILSTTKKIALHYKNVVGARGVNLLHASGVEAQQSVPHFHIHLIPRFENDGLNLWPCLPEAHYNKEELLEKLQL